MKIIALSLNLPVIKEVFCSDEPQFTVRYWGNFQTYHSTLVHVEPLFEDTRTKHAGKSCLYYAQRSFVNCGMCIVYEDMQCKHQHFLCD